MANINRGISRRSVITGLPVLIGSVLLYPAPAAGFRFIGLIFRVATVGFGTVATAVGLGLTLLTAGAISSFRQGSYSSYRSYAGGGIYSASAPSGWTPYVPPKPVVVKVSLDPNDQVKGDVLLIRAIQHDILVGDSVMLPDGGRLVIEEDGTMRFADTAFDGYARLSNVGVLTVFSGDNSLVLTRSRNGAGFHHNFHDSHDGRLAVASLIGEVRHV